MKPSSVVVLSIASLEINGSSSATLAQVDRRELAVVAPMALRELVAVKEFGRHG